MEHVEIVDAEDSQFVPLSIMERTGVAHDELSRVIDESNK